MNYDFIAVASDTELMSAFISVMKQVDFSLKLKMAVPSQFYYKDVPNAMRSVCNEEKEVKNLVNQKLKEDRYSIVLENNPGLTFEELDKSLN